MSHFFSFLWITQWVWCCSLQIFENLLHYNAMDLFKLLGKLCHHVNCVGNVRTNTDHHKHKASYPFLAWKILFLFIIIFMWNIQMNIKVCWNGNNVCFNQLKFGNDFQNGFKFFKKYKNIVTMSPFFVFLYIVLFEYVNTQNRWNWWNLKCSGLKYD